MHTLENDSDTIQYRKTGCGSARALLNTPHPIELDALPLVFLLVAPYAAACRQGGTRNNKNSSIDQTWSVTPPAIAGVLGVFNDNYKTLLGILRLELGRRMENGRAMLLVYSLHQANSPPGSGSSPLP